MVVQHAGGLGELDQLVKLTGIDIGSQGFVGEIGVMQRAHPSAVALNTECLNAPRDAGHPQALAGLVIEIEHQLREFRLVFQQQIPQPTRMPANQPHLLTARRTGGNQHRTAQIRGRSGSDPIQKGSISASIRRPHSSDDVQLLTIAPHRVPGATELGVRRPPLSGSRSLFARINLSETLATVFQVAVEHLGRAGPQAAVGAAV